MIESTDISDELVAAATAGDQRALGTVLAVIRPLVVRYCRATLGRDDVAQGVCRAVLAALPGYRVQPLPFLAFVYGIAAHSVAELPRAERMPDGMARLLESLPEQERETLILRVAVGLSVEATAEAVGSTPGAVRMVQHRALAGLRRGMPQGEPV